MREMSTTIGKIGGDVGACLHVCICQAARVAVEMLNISEWEHGATVVSDEVIFAQKLGKNLIPYPTSTRHSTESRLHAVALGYASSR